MKPDLLRRRRFQYLVGPQCPERNGVDATIGLYTTRLSRTIIKRASSESSGCAIRSPRKSAVESP
jgi:hypothetical protein